MTDTPGGPRPDAPLLAVEDLTTTLVGPEGRITPVDRVSFSLEAGEVLGLVGESGCGKTMTALTLLRLLPGRSSQVSGHAYFEGRDLVTMPDAELRRLRGRDIAMIFQDPMTSLNPVIPIGTQISETIQLHMGLDRRAAEQRTLELLEMVEIPDAARRMGDYQHQFSGGMRQRVMIAMAVSCHPKLVIADEATTALDVTIQAQILDLLRTLIDDLGTSVILISHDLGVVASMCDRVNVMYAGRIVETADASALFTEARMPYTWGLVESLPQLSGSGREVPLPTISGAPPMLNDDSDRCRFSPRCGYARDVCREAEPKLSVRDGAHLARCWGTEDGGWIR